MKTLKIGLPPPPPPLISHHIPTPTLYPNPIPITEIFQETPGKNVDKKFSRKKL